MAALKRLKQAFTLIGALTVAAGLALVGLAVYVWWDTRDAGTADLDDDFETDFESGSDFDADSDAEVGVDIDEEDDADAEDTPEADTDSDDAAEGDAGTDAEEPATTGEAADD